MLIHLDECKQINTINSYEKNNLVLMILFTIVSFISMIIAWLFYCIHNNEKIIEYSEV
jgi:predicted negative regulator of RcsB-dependent stress response